MSRAYPPECPAFVVLPLADLYCLPRDGAVEGFIAPDGRLRVYCGCGFPEGTAVDPRELRPLTPAARDLLAAVGSA